MAKVELSKKEKERFLKILNKTKLSYLQVMKSFHNQNVELVHSVLEEKDDVVSECEDFYSDNCKIEHAGLLGDKLKSMINIIHNMGRVVYQCEFTEK